MQQTPDTMNPENAPGIDQPTESQENQQAPGELQERLQKAEKAAEENREAWLRAVAESDNIRKRAQTEVSNAHKFALESFAAELLPVKDSLEAALASENVTVESLKTGDELTLKQLRSALEKFNVTEVNPVGQKFDPHRHQAMTVVDSDAEPNTVVQVLQKGYMLHDRVLRPALVTVAKSKNA
jgi:molecular chaperone GrpE